MSNIQEETPTITRGDLQPDLAVMVGDDEGFADFTTITPADCIVLGEMNDVLVVNDQPTTCEASLDGKTMLVVREWVAGETDLAGRMHVTVRVLWPGGEPQTFPDDTPLILNIRRRAGDA